MELRRRLKVISRTKHLPEQERGRINQRALTRLITNPNFKAAFKEKSRKETNEVAVQLVVDGSGSMDRNLHATRLAAASMAESLKDMGIPFEVIGFEAVDNHMMAQQFGDKPCVGRRTKIFRMKIFKSFNAARLDGLAAMRAEGWTPLNEAVRYAAKRLAMRREKRKIMIVFSDGCCDLSGDCGRDILDKDLMESVEKAKALRLEVIGFGIKSRAVEKYFPENVFINDISELCGEALKKLGDLLTRK
jgi:cobalamin biosynthesis protein CobT